MLVAKNPEYSREVHRPRSNSKEFKARSFYVHSNWIRDPLSGGYLGTAKVNDAQQKPYADLISSCYFNPKSKTWTCYGIPLDIDANITHVQYLNDDGSVAWPKVVDLLTTEIPALADAISDVTRSTGGKGFGLLIPISPLELKLSNHKAERKGRALQKIIILILKSYGIGADMSARGLKRDMPNWRNPLKQIDCNFRRREDVQSKGLPVISNLLKALSRHPAVYSKRSEHPEKFLAIDSRSEAGLAKLYEHLLYEFSDPCLSFSEIQEITGLSRMCLTKFLRVSPPAWLISTYLGREEGYRLSLRPSPLLTARASQVLRPEFSVNGSVCAPEDVEDGSRNEWLKQIILRMKWAGIEMKTAALVARDVALRIPGALASQNVREIPLKIQSYYHRFEDLFGIRDLEILPDFIARTLPSYEKTAEVIAMPKIMSKSPVKKGESEAPRRAVSKNLVLIRDEVDCLLEIIRLFGESLPVMGSRDETSFKLNVSFDWQAIKF
ncbi:MAG: hypothetical protein EOP04_17325 [Proteobacteria bacterium]|nr:MAG: hypothetical protein EOP04_17325 [Pseudomonadota bacterium]